MLLTLIEQNGAVRLSVKAVPGSSRDRIVGELGGALKVAVAAAPERGAANRAIVALLARSLRVHPSQISIARGQTGPRKELWIRGLSAAEIQTRLSDCLN